jgi:hypothetical protein
MIAEETAIDYKSGQVVRLPRQMRTAAARV